MDDKVKQPGDPFEKTVVDLHRITEPAPQPSVTDDPPPGVAGSDEQSIDFDLPVPPPPLDLSLVDKDPLIVIDRRQGKAIEEQHRHEIEIEDRRFRNWIMKMLVSCFCTVVILMVGGMIYSTYVKGNNTSESTLKAFMETVTEILRVLKPETKED